MNHVSASAAFFAVFYVGHEIGDHWLQTHSQGQRDGDPRCPTS
jgi:hypothetical protein